MNQVYLLLSSLHVFFRKESISTLGQTGLQQNKRKARWTCSVHGVWCFSLVTWCHGFLESVSFLFCCNVIHSHWSLRFFHHHVYRCFGCSVREGYGMTETSCVISSMDEGDNLSGHVGSPNPACGKKHNVWYKIILVKNF